MIRIFHRSGNEILLSNRLEDLATLNKADVLWIDLIDPSGDEKRAAEAFNDAQIQSRAQAEEIESSSRFHEAGGIIFANTNFLSPTSTEMSMDAVSFILAPNTLTTLREIPIRSFDLLSNKIQARPELYKSGFSIFVEIMDKRVDLDADIVELIAQETSQFSKRINQMEDINEEFLLDINQLQENTMLVRENIVDKQRLISNMLRSDKYPKELHRRFSVLLQDINSLINHTNFGFERLEYLQDTVVGLINLDQNKIMKIFTLVSVLLMPPTLVASFYGMNVPMPLMDKSWMWVLLLGVMLLTVALVLFLFKRNKLL